MAIWAAILAASAILFSLALACAMPFAALGAAAALTLPPRRAFAVAAAAWAVNQAIGFGVLDYPTDPRSLAWGVAIVISALAAVACAVLALRIVDAGVAGRLLAAFVAGFVAQQLVIVLAGIPLSGFHVAVQPWVIGYMLGVNALAFAVFLALQWSAARGGIAAPLAARG